MTDRGFTVLEAVEKVATAAARPRRTVALSWLAHRPGITAPIASATAVAQLTGPRRDRAPARRRRARDARPCERLEGELAPAARDLREDEHSLSRPIGSNSASW